MKVIKPLNQGLLFKVFEDARKCYLSVAVFNFFPFEASSGLLSEIDMWKFVASELGKDAVLDMCMPKPKCEVLVVGKCFAPKGKPVPAYEVRLQIGPIDKTLNVYGDRFWKRKRGILKTISDPLPFTEMDITYENAFGGPDYKKNPLGKGHAPVKTDSGDTVHPLPNIEDPRDLIDSPKKKPNPAGFAPIDLTWPQRFDKVGTYDEKWQTERFPGLAEDIDWTFFNAAPEDQHIDGYFKGSEPFNIKGMHPEKPLLEANLPGFKSRCFINQKTKRGEQFKEIDTRLDTVWLFPYAERGIAIYRGVSEVQTDDAEDVLHMLLAYERLTDKPRSFEHYREAFLKRIDEEKGYLHLLDEKDLIPPGEKSGFAALMEEAGEKQKSVLAQNMAKRAERERQKAREMIKQMGLDPDQFIPEKPPEQQEFSIDNLAEIQEFAKKAEADAMAKKAEMEQDLRKTLAAQGMDYDQVVEQAKRMGGGLPKFSAEKNIEQLRAAGFNDPEMEKKLYQAEETIKKAYRQFAHQFPPAPLPPAEEAARMREAVLAGYREGKTFAGQDLTGADLSNLDLKNIDLKDAMLEGANLSGADLSGADLSGCVLARADLTGARCAGAKMAEACLGAANLSGADFSGVELTKAAFGKADLTDADLSGTTMDGADFMEAKLSGATLSRTTLKETLFYENDLSRAVFAEADLSRSQFINANIEEADFSGATLSSAIFVGVRGGKTVFRGADMTKACAANETSFAGADFRGATLTQAGLRGCDFSGANFEGANLEMTDLSECNLKGANFYRAFARQARFEKSDLEGANMVSINLFEGSLHKARLVTTNLSGANLYGAEVFRAVFGETNLQGANLKKTKIEKWIPE
ncbi:MAG: DUF2169 domain-containing protein [Deltaproteobacteria bacterium]|nr:MAG: DUF2169 domain-containing protein [Deltaproteobacteria bacterium]